MILASMYIPLPFASVVIEILRTYVASRLNAPLCLLGDFNAILDPNLDRMCQAGGYVPSLSKWK